MMARDMDPQALSLAAAFPDVARVGDLLRRRGMRIAVAESCTGGLLGAALTAVPGSSDYVLGGVIAYANSVKTELLGVPEELLRTYGAVSEQCAAAMAEGVRPLTGAEVGVSITGVAGPGSEGSSKPPGLIYVAAAAADMPTRVVQLDGDHGREANRVLSVQAALLLVADLVAGEAS
jgi:PncC family amidohydrolase